MSTHEPGSPRNGSSESRSPSAVRGSTWRPPGITKSELSPSGGVLNAGERPLQGITGIVRALQERTDERGQVLTFRVERHDAEGRTLQVVPVEIRGLSFEGFLSEGDSVEIRGRWKPGKTLHIRRLRNLSTGGRFRARGRPRRISYLLLTQIKVMLTKLGKYSSPNLLRRLNATANYIALGQWFRDNGMQIPVIVKDRREVFKLAAEKIANEQILYLEFGVWKGDATRDWSRLLKNPASILHGFDSFEGLPEDWNYATGKAHFSTGGHIPIIDDPRLKFFKGWFSDTLPKYDIPPHERLFLNMDADLYSSTKTVLDHLKNEICVGTYIYFDEFNDRWHELKAFDEFLKETKMKFKVIGANPILQNVLFQRIG